MSKHLILDNDYNEWIAALSSRYRSAQIKAAVEVNRELLSFYWQLGKDIAGRGDENKYGSGFIKMLSRDLKEAIPEARCFSEKNLYYIRRFYIMYSEIFPQDGGESNDANFPQVGGILFSVPWGHHKLLIDKYFAQPNVALFYLSESVKQG